MYYVVTNLIQNRGVQVRPRAPACGRPWARPDRHNGIKRT